MTMKVFYDKHKNFSFRNASDYYLSPGIQCKFDLIIENLKNFKILKALDLGCSGNSFLDLFDDKFHKSYLDISSFPLKRYVQDLNSHPLCGDMCRLPYRDDSFDFICALDVLEHVKDDKKAVSEINRILRRRGLLVITVPHRKKYYSYQDKIIGHYRRYEIEDIFNLFQDFDFKFIRYFGVYGQLMKISFIQSNNPSKTEESLLLLRKKYETDILFRKLWIQFVNITKKLMKIDAKFQPKRKIMNIAFIFTKKSS
ncbi:MAG: class I SAM-dependent methyltransferase [Promethearchaeota archaeon]